MENIIWLQFYVDDTSLNREASKAQLAPKNILMTKNSLKYYRQYFSLRRNIFLWKDMEGINIFRFKIIIQYPSSPDKI